MTELPQQLRLSVDWELWVIEQLLFTAKLEDIVEVLTQRGIDAGLARARVVELAKASGFEHLRQRVGEARMAARLLRLQDELERAASRPVQVHRRARIDAQSMLEQHWATSTPVVLTEAARAIPAVQRWSLQSLAARFPALEIQVNVDRLQAETPPDTERQAQTMTLRAFVDRVEREPSNDFYVVSRNGLLARPELVELWSELVELPPFLVALEPPRGVSLWVGPAGTITPPHFDPHNVLLVQVQGRKRIRLASRIRAGLHTQLDGYYLARPIDEVFATRPELVATVELQPGEALFVPAAWFHEVTALEPSMTLSFLNFRWPNHFHWLGPTGSDDRD